MTKGQRALIGWTAALLVSLVLWALITSAFAQSAVMSRFYVQFGSPADVNAECGRITDGRLHNVAACANPGMLIAQNPCLYRRESYARNLCHEYTCHMLTGRADHNAPGCLE